MRTSAARHTWAAAGLVAALAALVYVSAGFGHALDERSGAFVYAGQRALDGRPVDASVFAGEGPLAVWSVAGALALGRLTGGDPVRTARWWFVAAGCLTVAALYLLMWRVTSSRRASLLGAVSLLCFVPFGAAIAGGPEPQTLTVLFCVLCVWLLGGRRWLAAGACGSVADLLWPPMLVLPTTVLLLAALQPRPQAARSALCTLAGVAMPLAAFVLLLAIQGGLPAGSSQPPDFDPYYALQGPALEPGATPAQSLILGHGPVLLPIWFGLLMIAGIYLQRLAGRRSWRDVLAEEPLGPVLATLPLVALLGLNALDNPALYPLYPYLALGFGLFLDAGVRYLEEQRVARMWIRWGTAGLCLALMAAASVTLPTANDGGLDAQRAALASMKDRFGPDVRMAAIGVSAPLALLARPAAVDLPPDNLVGASVNRSSPAGFEDWLRQVEAYQPDVLVVGAIAGEHAQILDGWARGRFELEQIAHGTCTFGRDHVRAERCPTAWGPS